MRPILNRTTLCEQVASYLVKYIRENGLRPGDLMPSEFRISADLGVSRGIVREAFRSLATTGIIEVASGKKARVANLRQAALTSFMEHGLLTDQILPVEMLQVRRILEEGGARLAALHRLESDVCEMRHLMDLMMAFVQDRGAFVDHDLRLHLAIAQATKNTLYSLLTASLGEALESSIRVGMERSTSQDVEMSLQEHQDIVEAIAAGDPSMAEQAMRVHFDDAIRIVIGDESV